MIGFAFTNGPAVIPPWGGRRPYFGTNPVACAIPAAGLPPVVIDLSGERRLQRQHHLGRQDGGGNPKRFGP